MPRKTISRARNVAPPSSLVNRRSGPLLLAALLSAQAALRTGAGLVTICTSAEAARSLDQRVVEVMTEALDPDKPLDTLQRALEGTMAVVVGPGLGLSATARALVEDPGTYCVSEKEPWSAGEQ